MGLKGAEGRTGADGRLISSAGVLDHQHRLEKEIRIKKMT